MPEKRKILLAERAVRLAGFGLQKKLPALSAALSIQNHAWTDQSSGTDAETLYWNADEILELFSEKAEKLQRKYLHLVLHGLYLHRLRGAGYPETNYDRQNRG